MRSLLGLELPERLDTDLDVLINRKRKQLAQGNDLQKIEEIEAQLNQLAEQKGRAKQELASLTNKKEWAEHELQQAQDKFLAEGGKIAAEKAQLEAKRTQLETELEAPAKPTAGTGGRSFTPGPDPTPAGGSQNPGPQRSAPPSSTSWPRIC